MKFKRQVVVLTLVASLVVGGTAAVAAYPMAGDTPQKMTAGQKIEQWAQKLGITTQDKSIADLAREIREARQNMFKQSVYRAAAKLNITTEGCGDVRQARLYKAAERLNVPTRGRTLEDIAKDVKAASKAKRANNAH